MAMTDHQHRSVIAVVDDDPRILGSLEILLNSADYGVLLFPSAAALLESGVLPEIDCLISDVAMPGMDGFELVRAVQATRPGLRVILVTGRHDLLKRSSFDSRGHYRLF
jgi:FixJ family two-component response regulator